MVLKEFYPTSPNKILLHRTIS